MTAELHLKIDPPSVTSTNRNSITLNRPDAPPVRAFEYSTGVVMLGDVELAHVTIYRSLSDYFDYTVNIWPPANLDDHISLFHKDVVRPFLDEYVLRRGEKARADKEYASKARERKEAAEKLAQTNAVLDAIAKYTRKKGEWS